MQHAGHFRHEALLYAGPADFVAQVAPFIVEGVGLGEPTLVVVDAPKITALRDSLGSKADAVEFVDMGALGVNPNRIIPAWQDFVARRAPHGPVRGVGEPDWARTNDGITECHRHEALLNVAFDGPPPWWLVCPYDTAALPAAVIAEAHRTHPIVRTGGISAPSSEALSVGEHARESTRPLRPAPPTAVRAVVTDAADVEPMRHLVASAATDAGVSEAVVDDVALVVGELASNSLRHAKTAARVAAWATASGFVVEVRDGGRIEDPLVGRRRPPLDAVGGRGLWITNQLADLVQHRSVDGDNVVRAHFPFDR